MLCRLPAFGPKLAQKLAEIASTHTLRRLNEAATDPITRVRALLENIYGVGSHTSLRWYKQGVRTLDDVRRRKDLTPAQRIGVDRYEDFGLRMKRAETERHFAVVQEVVAGLDQKAECECMGSYRRGRPECGDIDILITKPDTSLAELRNLLLRAVMKLFQADFLKCALSGPDPREYNYNVSALTQEFADISKWYGASALEDIKIWRRIDFLIVPDTELGASLLYFTGNQLFNRSMRLLALKKGYSLSQHGLFKGVVRVGRTKTTNGTLVEGRSERKIFEALGLPYREPSERNVI